MNEQQQHLKRYAHLADLQPLVGKEVAVSDWMQIDQARIDAFAQATGDHQWIHTDPERAAGGPFGVTVAHGFLTLSLVPMLANACIAVDDVRMAVNYGLNRVRFMTPVRVGSLLRARFVLQSFDPLPGGAQLVMQATLELQGADKPACVADTVSRRYT